MKTKKRKTGKGKTKVESKGYTSLEAVCCAIEHAGLGEPNRDGSELLSKFANKEPNHELNTIEFIAAWGFVFGNEFSDALGDTVHAYFHDPKVTVKDFADMIHRAFCEKKPSETRFTDCDGGEDCPHYEHREDIENLTGIQDCYSCRFWDNAHLDGKCHDCTVGECTWRWKDPNGDAQTTFPFADSDEAKGKRVIV